MKLTNDMLERLGAAYALGEAAQTRRMKVSGMTFDIAAYKVEGLGHVSVMIASGFFGLMKMDTLIITPTAVDMHAEDLEGSDVVAYPLQTAFRVERVN